jgi:hypothetical protein
MNIMSEIFEIFRRVMLADPKAARKDAADRFYAEVVTDKARVRAIIDAEFYRLAAQWEPKEIGPGNHTLAGTPATARRAVTTADRATSAARIAKVREELVASIRPFIWLEMEMPNGKKLRHCTGAELAKFGGAFLEMSKHLKPTQVVDRHLSEADLRAIYSRFNGSSKRVA